MTGSLPPDDRVLPFTRMVAAIVIVILVFAWVVLFLLPAETDRRFAWTIQPTMTAMLMGAGYGSALYFFARVLVERRWHRVALGFLPTSVFTWMMLGATFLHWDRFRHGSLPFLLWLWIYLITPLLVPAVWVVNRRRDSGVLEAGDAAFPAGARAAMPPGDEAALARAVTELVEDPDRRRRAAVAARAAGGSLDIGLVADAYAELFGELLSAPVRRGAAPDPREP